MYDINIGSFQYGVEKLTSKFVVYCFVLGDDKGVLSFLGYGDNMVLEILGGMALAVAHVILNFWYGKNVVVMAC